MQKGPKMIRYIMTIMLLAAPAAAGNRADDGGGYGSPGNATKDGGRDMHTYPNMGVNVPLQAISRALQDFRTIMSNQGGGNGTGGGCGCQNSAGRKSGPV